MKQFSSWLNENFKGLVKFNLFEASNKISNTEKGWNANQDKLKILGDLFGVEGKLLTAEEAQVAVNADKPFSNVFLGKKSDTIKVIVSKPFVQQTIEVLNAAGVKATIGGEGILLTFDDGMTGQIYSSGIVITKKGGKNGEMISSNILPSQTTEIQEPIYAAILEAMAHKDKVNGELPEYIAEYLGPRKVKSLDNFDKWILSSDPVQKTGICRYVDFPGANSDVRGFQLELCNFLCGAKSDTWLKAFNNLYHSNVIEEIGKVFKNGVANWSAARFIHFHTRATGKSAGFGKGSWVGSYLSDNRTDKNVQKDTIDKSDIFLCFNTQKAKQIVDEMVPGAEFTREQYCSIMNKYVNDKDFIGISLKKIGGGVSVSAVNFKVFTTAQGDNISDDKKVRFKFEAPKSKNNTLDITHAKIMNPELTDEKGKLKVTFQIAIPFNKGHGHDIHVPDNEIVLINVRSNSTSGLSCTVEGSFKSASAQLGKMNTAIEQYVPGFNPTAMLKRFCGASKTDTKASLDPEVVAQGYRSVAEEILQLFKKDEELCTRIIALGAGYPVEEGTKEEPIYIMDSSPYVKIY